MDDLFGNIAMMAQSPHIATLQRALQRVAEANQKRTAASVAPLQVQLQKLRIKSPAAPD